MTERRQFVGHRSTAEAASFTGLSREITVDMQAETLRLHDGNTKGGFPLMRADMANATPDVLNTALRDYEKKSNKTNVINENSTATQYPNAQAAYRAIRDSHSLGDIKQSLQTNNHGHWLLCNGQEVSRSEYPSLFNLIGINFGSGDGINTFNLPDYRGKFLRGLGGNSANDFYATQEEGLPNIEGWFHGCVGGADGSLFVDEGNPPGGVDNGDYRNPKVSFNASRLNPIYGASEHVTPVNQAVNFFIYAY